MLSMIKAQNNPASKGTAHGQNFHSFAFMIALKLGMYLSQRETVYLAAMITMSFYLNPSKLPIHHP